MIQARDDDDQAVAQTPGPVRIARHIRQLPVRVGPPQHAVICRSRQESPLPAER